MRKGDNKSGLEEIIEKKTGTYTYLNYTFERSKISDCYWFYGLSNKRENKRGERNNFWRFLSKGVRHDIKPCQGLSMY